MDLFLMRHGIAEDFDPELHTTDGERALTPKGWRRTRRVCLGLVASGWRPNLVLHSPLRRAVETAGCIRELLPEVPLELCTALAGSSVEDLWDEVAARSVNGTVLVGHQPLLGDLATHLLGMQGQLLMKRASMAHLDVTVPRQRPADLVALLPPVFSRNLRK